MIFKSKQVNTDPLPWVHHYDPTDRSSSDDLPGGLRDYKPRPEFNVTRDPEPWECHTCGARSSVRTETCGDEWKPRPEYDHPVNRILVAFRERSQGLDAAASWYTALSLAWGPVADASPDETEHAMKALLRLAIFQRPA